MVGDVVVRLAFMSGVIRALSETAVEPPALKETERALNRYRIVTSEQMVATDAAHDWASCRPD